jgi:hypothetical protein
VRYKPSRVLSTATNHNLSHYTDHSREKSEFLNDVGMHDHDYGVKTASLAGNMRGVSDFRLRDGKRQLDPSGLTTTNVPKAHTHL